VSLLWRRDRAGEAREDGRRDDQPLWVEVGALKKGVVTDTRANGTRKTTGCALRFAQHRGHSRYASRRTAMKRID
jgi:hypothetical protein